MNILFEAVKVIYFFFTVFVGLFFLRGELFLSVGLYDIVKQIIMPAYLLFTGLMLGYIVARIEIGTQEDHPNKHKIYIRSFIIGIVIGLVLSVIYVLV